MRDKLWTKWSILCAVALLIAHPMSVCGQEVEGRAAIERVVCTIDFSTWIPGLSTSVDAKHVAYIKQKGSRGGCWVLDGQDLQSYEDLRGPLVFSPDGNRYAYIAVRNGEFLAVVDGRESALHFEAIALIPRFSPDSKHLVYAGARAGRQMVVVDERAQRTYESLWLDTLTFSPDSTHVAYAANEKGKWFVVVDEAGGPRFDTAGGGLLFSPDSRKIAYVVQQGKQWNVMCDGVIGPAYESLHGLGFSPDSKRLAYLAGKGTRCTLVLDGLEGQLYDSLAKDEPLRNRWGGGVITFSPDSSRVATVVKDGAKWMIVINNKESDRFDGFTFPAFSPDGVHVAYCGRQGTAVVFVRDGSSITLSHMPLNPIIFSPNGAHVAYPAERGVKRFVVLDGKEGGRYDGISERSLSFGPQGRLLTYVALDSAGKMFVVANGTEGKHYDSVMPIGDGTTTAGNKVVFDSSSQFHYLAAIANRIILVQETVSATMAGSW